MKRKTLAALAATLASALALVAPAAASANTAEMYDTVDVSAVYSVTSNPFALAGYTSGNWPTYFGLRQSFPKAHTVSIAIDAWNYADCLDIEPGDADPSQAGGWARADIQHGFSKPCVYFSISSKGDVEASMAAAGFSRGQYFEWCAWYRYVSGLVPGCDAVQWTDEAGNPAGSLDESTVSLAFLSIAQPPYSAINAASFNEGYRLGYANGRSLPYDRGFLADHHYGTPASAQDFNSGYNLGWLAGRKHGYKQGVSGGQNAPVNPRDWNGSWSLGFDTGYATGRNHRYYDGFILTPHGAPISDSAYQAGWPVGYTTGYNSEFNAGYSA